MVAVGGNNMQLLIIYKFIAGLFYVYTKPTCTLTLCVLMSYIYGAPCKAKNFNLLYIYMNLHLAMLKAVSFYFMHNVSTLNQCRKFSCVTVVCKHFASYQGYHNYRWDLIRYTKG